MKSSTNNPRQPMSLDRKLDIALRYRPQRPWAEYAPVQDFVVSNIVQLEYEDERPFRHDLLALSELAMHAHQSGAAVDVEVIFHPLFFGPFVAARNEWKPPFKSTIRSVYRRMARELAKTVPADPRQNARRQKPLDTAFEPFLPAVEVRLWEAAHQQSTPLRTRTALAVTALGMGAGFTPTDTLHTQAKDVRRDRDGITVEAGYPLPRVVPVRERYAADLWNLASSLEPDEYLHGRPVDKQGSAANLTYSIDPTTYAATEPLRRSRLRHTWIRSRLVAGVPIADINAAAGGLSRLLLFAAVNSLSPTSDPNAYRRGLTLEPEGTNP